MGQVFTTVRQDQLAAYEVLGTVKCILPPGLHCFPPWAVVRPISMRVQENLIQTETKTKDNVFVGLHISVQQAVHPKSTKEAIYKLSNPSQQIESFVADVVRSHVPRFTLDDLMESSEDIANAVNDRLTVAMKDYGYEIKKVLVTKIIPDPRVNDAMNQINTNRRLRQAAEEKAEADKIVVVKKAEAEAESNFLQGQGLARSRAAIITGLREAVNIGQDGAQDLSSKDVTELLLMTQYLDTLEKMAHNPATTVFMPHSPAGVGDVSAQLRNGMMQASAKQ